MTPLRFRMTEDMQIRNLSPNTQSSYLQQVSLFARHFKSSPEKLGPEEIRSYQERLQTIPGIGPISSTSLVGFIGEAARFRSSHQFACYLGLTPREHFSGGKRQLGRISKQGDPYLRRLLIQGAHAVLVWAGRKENPDRFRTWALSVVDRRGRQKAVVAVANKMARLVWAVWTSGKPFQSIEGGTPND